MLKIISLPFLIVLLSCATGKKNITQNNHFESNIVKTESINNEDVSVVINIQRHFPYCGGAAPTNDMLNRYSPEVGDFILIDNSTQQHKTVRTDDTGNLRLKLSPGSYTIREKYKDTTFEAFYAIQNGATNQMYTINLDKDCYKKWWKSNLLDFSVNDSTLNEKFKITLRNSCFTGNNPCLIYNGPHPP